jgi:ATP-dependent Clp protease ATP-binding subunit ClpA
MFERFTNDARTVVTRAQEEAKGLGHPYIGTEHLLLGLLDPGAGTGYAVLHEVGLDRERVRAAVVRIIGTGKAPTDQAPLGDEDAEALQAIGIDLPAVRAKIEEVFGPGALDPPARPRRRGLLRRRRDPQCPPEPSGRVPFTARSKKVLELGLREALALGHHSYGTEHVLLGLIREGKGLAALIITDAGVSLDDLRTRTIARLDQAA